MKAKDCTPCQVRLIEGGPQFLCLIETYKLNAYTDDLSNGRRVKAVFFRDASWRARELVEIEPLNEL